MGSSQFWLQILDPDPITDETPPSLGGNKETVARLRDGEAAGVCNIREKLLKAGGTTMICKLHCFLTAITSKLNKMHKEEK